MIVCVNVSEIIMKDTAKAKLERTPTVFVNGKALDREAGEYGDLAKFRAALAAGGVK